MRTESLIITGRYREAVQREGVRDPLRVQHYLEARGVRSSIVAHLCLGRFKEAESMADGMVARFPRKVSWDYLYAGLCRWFQGRRNAAVSIWRDGLKCGYTFSRGLDSAMLLWYASIRYPSAFQAEDALELMQKPWYQQFRESYFMDAVVRFIMDEIDETVARKRANEEHWEEFVAENHAQLDFYVAVKHFSRGNRQAFHDYMMRSAESKGIAMMIPEVFLARFEAKMYPFQFPSGRYTRRGHPDKVARKRRTKFGKL